MIARPSHKEPDGLGGEAGPARRRHQPVADLDLAVRARWTVEPGVADDYAVVRADDQIREEGSEQRLVFLHPLDEREQRPRGEPVLPRQVRVRPAAEYRANLSGAHGLQPNALRGKSLRAGRLVGHVRTVYSFGFSMISIR